MVSRFENGKEIPLTEAEMADYEARLAAHRPLRAAYEICIASLLDRTAREREYDSAHSIVSYAGSTVEKWANEAEAFIIFRDAVWLYALTELQKVEEGARLAPTLDEFAAELPSITWPE